MKRAVISLFVSVLLWTGLSWWLSVPVLPALPRSCPPFAQPRGVSVPIVIEVPSTDARLTPGAWAVVEPVVGAIAWQDRTYPALPLAVVGCTAQTVWLLVP